MIYVVTGFQRSGTSMMMQALKTGGLPIYYNKKREAHLRSKHPDTNQGGFWEPSIEETSDIDFPLAAEGMCFKILAPWKTFGNLAVSPEGYQVILMTRDPREIVLSVAKINKGFLSTGDLEIFDHYDEYINKSIDRIQNRKDVHSLKVAPYLEVLSKPESFFQDLNWPIHASKAASTIDPTQYQSKFDKPPSGSIAQDLGLDKPMQIRDAILEGKIKASPEMIKAAKNGAQFGLQVT